MGLFGSKDIVYTKPSQAGKTFIVTGANSGIGYYAALEFARLGGHVVLACRSDERGRKAEADLTAELGTLAKDTGANPDAGRGRLEYVNLNLDDFSSVRRFAADFNARGQALNVLLNNAGIMMLPTREETVDGFEKQLATNVLGHHALTGLLLPSLQRQPDARVVNVSSLLAHEGNMAPEPVDFKREGDAYNAKQVYGDTKLCNLLHANAMARRYTQMRILAAHPGGTQTNLQKHAYSGAFWKMLLQETSRGALPLMRACLDPNAKSGDYFGPDGFYEASGTSACPAKKPKQAEDDNIADRYWKAAELATGVAY